LKALAEDAEMNFNYIDEQTVGISLNETTTDADVAEIIAVFARQRR
jgi:glycine dehydrogenase